MINNSKTQPVKILNAGAYLKGKIAVDKIISASAVELFLRYRKQENRGLIYDALRGVFHKQPRYVYADFKGLLRDAGTVK